MPPQTLPQRGLLGAALQGARADFALIALLLDDDRLLIHAATGPLAEDMAGNIMPVAESVAAPVLRGGGPLLVTDYPARGGAQPDVRPRIGSVVVVPLHAGPRVEGALAVGRLTGRPALTDAELVDIAAFVDRAETVREIDGAREERRTARLLEDRTRIAADLHDHVIQELFAIGMGLQRLAEDQPDDAHRSALLEQVDALDATVVRIRTMINAVPPRETDTGVPLPARVVAIVDSLTPALGTLPTLTLSGPVESSVSPGLAHDVEAVLREGLSNVARHARATSVHVRVAVHDDRLTVEVVDDGCGIGVPQRSSGLTNLRRRAAAHRGELLCEALPRGGTRLRWSVPLGAR